MVFPLFVLLQVTVLSTSTCQVSLENMELSCGFPLMHIGICKHTLGSQLVEPQREKKSMRVVLEVTEGLRGLNVTCDNFFNSHELGEALLKKKITMVDTVRRNKPELPPALIRSN